MKVRQKKIVLAVDHTTWWKAKKIRKESANQLKRLRRDGWKLHAKLKRDKKDKMISTKTYKEYFLYRSCLKLL